MRFTDRYPLVPHGPKRLEIVRNRTWSEVDVRLDRVTLGRTYEQELMQGIDYALGDEGVLHVKLEHGPRGVPFLYISRNGHPLPGSEGDPAKIIRDTVSIIGIIAFTQTTFAGMITYGDRADESIDWMLGLGIILLLLCFLAWRRSLAGMVLAAGLCFSEILLVIITQVHWNLGTIFPMSFALSITGWLMWRGIAAVREINAHKLPIRHPPEVQRPP
jgi:hypothetical protein